MDTSQEQPNYLIEKIMLTAMRKREKFGFLAIPILEEWLLTDMKLRQMKGKYKDQSGYEAFELAERAMKDIMKENEKRLIELLHQVAQEQ